MDKQKQIEEMARDLKEEKLYALINKTSYMRSAENLYDLGYRKIPENAVVIPKKLYELYMNEFHNYEVGKRNGSKETAEKFAEKVKASAEIGALLTVNASPIYNAIVKRIDEIAKEFTGGANGI
jgi:hypothetical protein